MNEYFNPEELPNIDEMIRQNVAEIEATREATTKVIDHLMETEPDPETVVVGGDAFDLLQRLRSNPSGLEFARKIRLLPSRND